MTISGSLVVVFSFGNSLPPTKHAALIA